VIRQANNIPQKSVLKAGSTILVPKISASVSRDIAPEVADSATVAYEAERSSSWQNHSQGLRKPRSRWSRRACRARQPNPSRTARPIIDKGCSGGGLALQSWS
jgi:hypothetical protein